MHVLWGRVNLFWIANFPFETCRVRSSKVDFPFAVEVATKISLSER